MTRNNANGPRVPRPEKGRVLFYHRDSSGRHETTPSEFVRWGQGFCEQNSLSCTFTPDQINAMIRNKTAVRGDLFLDWNVGGNDLSRPALEALFAEIEVDPTVSHVLIPRPDRLARPSEVEVGIALERRFRQRLGVWLVFKNRVCRPLKRGESMAISEWLQAALEYEQAGRFRREHAEKMLLSQTHVARLGFSTGGRAKYGLERWLIAPDGQPERALDDGEIVRRQGYHVAWLPKSDGTFEIRQRIKDQLRVMPATQLAQLLTTSGVPTPDNARKRRDNGIEHLTSGVWHATTLVNIGRDGIDAGVTSYGKRSMGDQLRFSPKGPRELEEQDFRADDLPKVTQNPKHDQIIGIAHYPPTISADVQAQLNAILDLRAGTQRGKPRSRTPQQNPLGSRIFDMECGWPMYRAPYNGSFRYICGLYLQSHACKCHHNHADGPTAVRFLLSCVQQRVLQPDRMQKLEQKLTQIAARELGADKTEKELSGQQADLAVIERQLETAGRNLALAATPEQRHAITKVFDELQEQHRNLQSSIVALQKQSGGGDAKAEIAAAMNVFRDLAEMVKEPNDFSSAAALFQRLNVRLFLRFRETRWGKRTVHKPAGGVVTFGNAKSPIQLYEGPTGHRQLKLKATVKTLGTAMALPDGVKTNCPGREGDLLRNVNRGDRI